MAGVSDQCAGRRIHYFRPPRSWQKPTDRQVSRGRSADRHIVGAIAGGAKGAAIGAAAGAASAAGAQVVTRGHELRVPVESLLTFRLDHRDSRRGIPATANSDKQSRRLSNCSLSSGDIKP
jgi:hypothetical protein